jgi:hypothetical protein
MEEQVRREGGMPLEGLTAGVDHLEAVVVFPLSQGSSYASWVRPTAQIDAPSIAASFRDVYLAAASTSARLGATPDSARSGAASPRPAVITIEEGARVTFIHRVRAFGVAIVFDNQAPLGLARAHAQKIARTLEHELPLDVAPPASPPPPQVRIGSLGPVSQAAVTMMTPTLAAITVAEEAAPETSPAPRIHRVGEDTEEAVTSDRQAGATPGAPPSAPVGGANERTNLTRPASPAAPQSSRPAPVPALSLTDAGSTGADVADSVSGIRAPESADGPPEGRAIRLMAYVEATSIEPHISILRLALRSGLGLARLRDPQKLTPPDLVLLETAAEEMLGLERGKLVERIRAAVPLIPLPARGAP